MNVNTQIAINLIRGGKLYGYRRLYNIKSLDSLLNANAVVSVIETSRINYESHIAGFYIPKQVVEITGNGGMIFEHGTDEDYNEFFEHSTTWGCFYARFKDAITLPSHVITTIEPTAGICPLNALLQVELSQIQFDRHKLAEIIDYKDPIPDEDERPVKVTKTRVGNYAFADLADMLLRQ